LRRRLRQRTTDEPSGYSVPELLTDIAPRHPGGLKLANPVMIASGTFGWDGYGRGLVPVLS